MKRSYLMRRPDDDDDDYYVPKETIRAKPINEMHSRKLGAAYQPRDFVRASDKSEKDFYRNQALVGSDVEIKGSAAPSTSTSATTTRPLTHDERNRISAKIIKAELKQDIELVKKLKRKLELGITENADSKITPDDKTVVLMKMDQKRGIVMPARSEKKKDFAPTEGKSAASSSVETTYRSGADLEQLMADEKCISAHDQLTMFGRAINACGGNVVDDDYIVDDNILAHMVKRRHAEKEANRSAAKRVKEHKKMEQTLDSCRRCVDSKHLEKHAIVAMGLKTYLAVVSWEGLSDEHCYVAPMAHYASQVVLDEDVYEELQLWFKGLNAMWTRVNEPNAIEAEEPEDCVFFETAKNVNRQGHMIVECMPLPRSVGELAPIYFKKAILDSEKEWSDNQKLIELAKAGGGGGIRRAVHKGFSYFAVNFGLQPGYAHVIEHDDLFPAHFAHEIIAGMLDLSHKTWRNVRFMSLDEVKAKRDKLRARWQPYDWTAKVRAALSSNTDSSTNSA